MAYEIKVLLSLLADTALRTESKAMYKVIAKIANTEGVVLKPYDEAKAEIEADDNWSKYPRTKELPP
jgi:hypothetical protein